MRKILISLSLGVLFASCVADDLDTGLAPQTEPSGESRIEYLAKNAVYDASNDAWAVRQGDPYSMGNIQAALDNLAAGTAQSQVPAGVLRELTLATRAQTELKPTHWALKVWPKTEEEQSALEADEALNVSYHPFDVALLSEEETELLMSAGVPSTRATIDDERKYSVTYEGYVDEEGLPVAPVTMMLSVLYVAWPVGKALPAEMEYEKLYDIYHTQPENDNGFSAEALQALETEAIQQIIPSTAIGTRVMNSEPPRGTIRHYDSYLKKYVPMAGLKVRLTSGSKIWEEFTDASGFFYFNESINTAPLNISLYFQDRGRWTISREGRMEVFVDHLGMYGNFTFNNREYNYGSATNLQPKAQPYWEMHRAVDYYFNRQNKVPRYVYDGDGLRIVAMGGSSKSIGGAFNCYAGILFKRAFIEIYNNNRTEHNRIIGATLHELGHWSQFGMKGKYARYKDVSQWLREAWASYVSWELCESYYQSQGWTRRVQSYPYTYSYISGADITGNAQQDWYYSMTTDTRYYSPLYIDLRDRFNQRQQYFGTTQYPDDDIQGVPYDVLERIARLSWDSKSFKDYLDDYIGVHFTRDQYNRYIDAFNKYVALHP